MKAALFKAPGDIELVERNLDTPQGNELIIKVDSCGVCGTDFHIYHVLLQQKTIPFSVMNLAELL